MADVVKYLSSGIAGGAHPCPTVAELVAFAEAVSGDPPLSTFVLRNERLPALGEAPPANYAGHPGNFYACAAAAVNGLVLVKPDGTRVYASATQTAMYYFAPDGAFAGTLNRAPLLPFTDKASGVAYTSQQMNAWMKSAQLSQREYRPDNPRAVCVRQAGDRHRPRLSPEEVARRREVRLAVRESASDGPLPKVRLFFRECSDFTPCCARLTRLSCHSSLRRGRRVAAATTTTATARIAVRPLLSLRVAAAAVSRALSPFLLLGYRVSARGLQIVNG